MKTYQYIVKNTWADGPWMQEPDKVQWQDEATDLVCLIVRSRGGGNLCGYVGVPEGHPLFGKDYTEADLSVHGGLTFSNFCHEEEGEIGICHIAEPGQPERVWWLGFDCAHLGDLAPHPDWQRVGLGGQYRTVDYVKYECAELARQLKEMAQPANFQHEASSNL